MAKLIPLDEGEQLPQLPSLTDRFNPANRYRRPADALDNPNMATEGMSGTQKFLAGAGKGMTDIYRGGRQIAGEMTPEEYDAIRATDRPLMQSGAGFVGNVVGQAAPFMAIPMTPYAGAVGTVGREAALRATPGIARAAMVGGAQGALTPVGSEDSRGINSALGVVSGGLSQAAVNGVARVISGPQRFANPEQGRLIARARELGFDLSPGQITQNPTLKSVEGAFADLPLTGGIERARAAANQNNLTRIAANAMGTTAPELGEDTVNAALRRSGGEIGRIARGTQNVPLTNDFGLALVNSFDEISALQPSTPGRAQALRLINGWADEFFNRGSITGAEQQANRSVLGAQAKAGMNDARSVPLARTQRAIQQALDNDLYRAVGGNEAAALRQARSQYAAGKSVEKAKPVAGNVSGPRLAEVMRDNVPSELRDAARVTQAFKIDIPNSGTPTRNAWMNLLQSPLAGVGAAAAGGGAASQSDNPYAIGAAAGLGALLGPRVAQGAYYNPLIRAYLTHGLIGGNEVPASLASMLARTGAPAAIQGVQGE